MKRWASLTDARFITGILIEDESNPTWAKDTFSGTNSSWVLLGEDDTTSVIGSVYNPAEGHPLLHQPYESWTIDATGRFWEPPTEYPGTQAGQYIWNEEKLRWVQV